MGAVVVTVRARTGLWVRANRDRKRPSMQLKIPEVGFQFLSKLSDQINKMWLNNKTYAYFQTGLKMEMNTKIERIYNGNKHQS